MIILHIGAQKTGTTSVQRFAARNRRRLRRSHRLWYPLYQDFGLKPMGYAHHEMAHALATDDGQRLQIARSFARSVMSGKREDETVLISAEPIYRHLYPATGDYWQRRANYATRLRTLFPSEDVVVVLVVRRQDEIAKSMYQERVKKSGTYSGSYEHFLGEREPFLYNRQASVFAEVFPKVRILVYEDLAEQGLVHEFLRSFGVDPAGLPQAPVRNSSLPLPLVEYKRKQNMTTLSPDESAALSRRLQRIGARYPVAYDWIDADAARKFLASFDEENEELRRTYLPERSRDLFPPFDAARAKPVFAGLTPEMAMKISKDARPHILSPLEQFARRIKKRL